MCYMYIYIVTCTHHYIPQLCVGDYNGFHYWVVV